MERESREMITTNEAAKILNVRPSTIHKYVKEGKLKPVYEENWHIDTTKLFFKEEVVFLKTQLIKPGITTGEAAELLGVHPTTISLYINQGELKAEKKKYRGREIYFIKPEELERFKSEYIETKKRGQKEFYDKDTGFAWFQSFTDGNGDTSNRILLDEDGNPFLSTSDGEKIQYSDITKNHYEPVSPIKNIKYKNKRGFAYFRFNESNTFYKIMELFYKYLGPKNMKVNLENNRVFSVSVKPVLIEEVLFEDIFNALSDSVCEGEVSKRLDGVYIDSDIEILSVAAPSELKKKIKKEAEEKKINMEDLVIRILNKHYNLSGNSE